MVELLKSTLWRQFGAAIQMLDNAIRSCPDKLWVERLWNDESMPPEFSEFWYVAYHTLFWLDLYLCGAIEGFIPPEPFTQDELNPAGLLPERVYTKDELFAYLGQCPAKFKVTIEQLTEEVASCICHFS